MGMSRGRENVIGMSRWLGECDVMNKMRSKGFKEWSDVMKVQGRMRWGPGAWDNDVHMCRDTL